MLQFPSKNGASLSKSLQTLNAAVAEKAKILGISALSLLIVASSQANATQQLVSRFAQFECEREIAIDRSRYRNVIAGKHYKDTLVIEGAEWNDTLIYGCKISGAKGDGIQIRNVSNVTIADCEITDVKGTGIRIRSSGSTEDVRILNNHIENVGENGISTAKRVKQKVDHIGVVIAGNEVIDSGKLGRVGRTHGIYTQNSDVVIFNNRIAGRRDGNGISIRSSGLVSCNMISGSSKRSKPGIRYFADNYTGPTRQLIITDNTILNASPAVELRKPDGWTKRKPEALVVDFIITGNTSDRKPAVKLATFWKRNDDISLEIEENSVSR